MENIKTSRMSWKGEIGTIWLIFLTNSIESLSWNYMLMPSVQIPPGHLESLLSKAPGFVMTKIGITQFLEDPIQLGADGMCKFQRKRSEHVDSRLGFSRRR